MSILRVYCDGSCFPNPGKGGWGWTTLHDGQFDSGGADPTTNQIMELTAVVRAIRSLYAPGVGITVVSDSMYVIKGATSWSKNWARNGWRNSQGSPVKNRPLWEELIGALKNRPILFEWVKGHSGDPGNEEADRLATAASGAPPELIARCKEFYHGKPRV